MTVITIGIDLAKNVFQIHGIDEHDKCQLKKGLSVLRWRHSSRT